MREDIPHILPLAGHARSRLQFFTHGGTGVMQASSGCEGSLEERPECTQGREWRVHGGYVVRESRPITTLCQRWSHFQHYLVVALHRPLPGVFLNSEADLSVIGTRPFHDSNPYDGAIGNSGTGVWGSEVYVCTNRGRSPIIQYQDDQ